MVNWLKNRLVDSKYFFWIIKNWGNLGRGRDSLAILMFYWVLYPLPRLLLGRERAHKLFPALSDFKKGRLIVPIPLEGKCIYWVALRDITDFNVFREVCVENHYNHSLIKPGMIVVDCGSHMGTFTLLASRKLEGTGKIIAIEPQLENFKQLEKNLELNGAKNCTVINAALSDHNGEEALFIADKSCGNTLIPSSSGIGYIGRTKVKVRTLDSLLEELNIAKVDFLKIDTEGTELEVLKGAEKLLLANPSVKIVMEFNHGKEAETINYLMKLKFSPSFFWDLIWV